MWNTLHIMQMETILPGKRNMTFTHLVITLIYTDHPILTITWGKLIKKNLDICAHSGQPKDVSGPRCCTEMSMPGKVVGARVRLTMRTEPRRMHSGCMVCCFSGGVC